MKINSYYNEHYDAIIPLRSRGINLNIIHNESPFLLAQSNPDIVIHPKSFMVESDYPTIKFVGPNCKFPNYAYEPIFGFDKESYTDKLHPIKSECSIINTRGDINIKFIKKLESMHSVRVWGRPINCIGYMGPVSCNTYEIYNSSKVCAADNEAELLKISYVKKHCYTPFDYLNDKFPYAFNIFGNNNKSKILINPEEFFNEKNWITIFNNIFEICGENKI